MYYIKAIAPNNCISNVFNYTRFGVVIPSKEIKIDSLKELFPKSSLSEEKLLNAMRNDNRVIIETENDRQANIAKEEKIKEPVKKEEVATKQKDEKRELQKEIAAHNQKKKAAQKTATKKDDIEVAKAEKELNKKIRRVNNGSK